MKTTEEDSLEASVDGIQETLNVLGDAHAWVEDGDDVPLEELAGDVCDDYQRLLRIIQILLLTGRLSREDLMEATDVEDHFA